MTLYSHDRLQDRHSVAACVRPLNLYLSRARPRFSAQRPPLCTSFHSSSVSLTCLR